MAKVNFKGNPVTLKGELPKEGDFAPDFVGVRDNLEETKLSQLKNKVTIILAVPSLDTSTCATEALQFSQKLGQKPDVQAIVVSEDLPFAMKLCMQWHVIENLMPLLDFRCRDLISKYDAEMVVGPLKGLSARAVIIVGEDNRVKYVELVPEVSMEPEYNKALA